MSNVLKCPYCNKPLHCGAILKSDEYLVELYQCANQECESTEFLVGCKEFWDILGQHKRTHKALGIALDWLREVATPAKCDDDLCREFTKRKLAEIKTTLEQKDMK